VALRRSRDGETGPILVELWRSSEVGEPIRDPWFSGGEDRLLFNSGALTVITEDGYVITVMTPHNRKRTESIIAMIDRFVGGEGSISDVQSKLQSIIGILTASLILPKKRGR
jgi:hypothetical protein